MTRDKENLTTEGIVLGKTIDYPKEYNPDILVAVPRSFNREQYGISSPPTEFGGFDAWHAYELGFLTQKGLPVTGLLKIVYPCTSPFLVESKSLKLYLNSFNMSRYGDTAREGIELVTQTIRRDLEKLLQCTLTLHFFEELPDKTTEFKGYELLEKTEEVESIEFNEFSEAPEVLEVKPDSSGEVRLATHLLRSNCKVTHQPDWGSAFIYLKGEQLPTEKSLLKYIVSFRNENHFHEEICEMLYKRLADRYAPEELMVACIYTRRGGIDICPVRASHNHLLNEALIAPDKLTTKLLRQ